jgi:hypothetical protein
MKHKDCQIKMIIVLTSDKDDHFMDIHTQTTQVGQINTGTNNNTTVGTYANVQNRPRLLSLQQQRDKASQEIRACQKTYQNITPQERSVGLGVLRYSAEMKTSIKPATIMPRNHGELARIAVRLWKK